MLVYRIFVLNYKEPEVLMKYLDMNNWLYKYVILSVKWGGHGFVSCVIPLRLYLTTLETRGHLWLAKQEGS